MLVFYTYIHIRNDTGQVFYVGKGKGRRAWKTSGRNERWRRTAEKAGVTVAIAAEWGGEEEAMLHEIALIGALRELGHPLVNLTHGGEGHAGLSPSESTRAKLSKAMRTHLDNDLLRKERGERFRSAWKDPKRRQEFIDGIKACHADPVWREQRAAAIRKGASTKKYKERKSGIMSRAWQDPEYRKKICRMVVCITNGATYESTAAAARELGLHSSGVSAVCRGMQHHAGGYVFRFADDPTANHPSLEPLSLIS